MATTFRGFKSCSCLNEWLPWYEKVLLAEGVIRHSIDVAQLVGGARASGGTHATGGAFDVWQRTMTAIKIARSMGADATWARTRAQGFDPHAHGVLRGCPHNGPARYQITSTGYGVDHGRNGLANRGRDDGPRPLSKRTWREGIAWAKRYLAEASPAEPPKRPEYQRPAAGQTWARWSFWNLAGYDATRGAKTLASRRLGIEAMVADEAPTVVGLIETGSPTKTARLSYSMARRGFRRGAAGRGRAIYYDGKRVRHHAGGVWALTPMHKKDRKHAVWSHDTVVGAEALSVAYHLANDAPLAVREDQFRDVVRRARAKAKQLDIPIDRIVLMGDDNADLDDLAERLGFVDTARAAHSTWSSTRRSTTSWDSVKDGGRIDKIRVGFDVVDLEPARPVTTFRNRTSGDVTDRAGKTWDVLDLSDHLIQSADLGRYPTPTR